MMNIQFKRILKGLVACEQFWSLSEFENHAQDHEFCHQKTLGEDSNDCNLIALLGTNLKNADLKIYLNEKNRQFYRLV